MAYANDPSITTSTPPAPARANMAGLAVAAVGIVIVNVAPFLDWVAAPADRGDGTEERVGVSGYETDSLIPFIAYLGIGLLVSMIYAARRSDRGQHRGLSLVSMAVALAATLQFLIFAFEPMGALERGDDLTVEYGVFVGLIGAVLWAIGSGLLAKQVEGDDRRDDAEVYGAHTPR